MAALVAASSAAASASFLIRADVQIGPFYVKKDGTLGGVVRAYGEPTAKRSDNSGSACTAAWPSIGLRATFANFGGQDPCSNTGGLFTEATMRAPGNWRTAGGLRIGSSAYQLRKLYPAATFHCDPRNCANNWWLLTRTSPYGGGFRCAGLWAHMRNGRVAWFGLAYQAAGD